MLRRTLQVELDDFFEYVLDKQIYITKQAFSVARLKLAPDLFKVLADMSAQEFYSDGNYDDFNGYRVLAIDGTTIDLPDYPVLRDTFGHVGNRDKTVRAKASILYDTLNNIIIDAEIDNYRMDERTLAKRHLEKLSDTMNQKDIILYDRGYPSRELIAYHLDKGIHFVMRSKKTFMDTKADYRFSPLDMTFHFTHKDKQYLVRRVIFLLETGEPETIFTSFMELDIKTIKSLYAIRWGIETKFHSLKYRLQIENFSGYSKIAILQDFYASIFLSNLCAAFEYDADLENNSGNKKYRQKANHNLLIGKLKNRFAKLLLSFCTELLYDFSTIIIDFIHKRTVPIKPNRSFPRYQHKKALKHSPNLRRSI